MPIKEVRASVLDRECWNCGGTATRYVVGDSYGYNVCSDGSHIDEAGFKEHTNANRGRMIERADGSLAAYLEA